MSQPELPPALKARVLMSVSKEPATAPGAFVKRAVAGAVVVMLWLGAAIALIGLRRDWGELPLHYSLGTVLVTSASAVTLSLLVLSRGPDMLGARVKTLLTLIVVSTALMGLWAGLVVASGPSSFDMGSTSETLSKSKACHLISTVLGVPIVVGLALVRRGLPATSPVLLGAATGGAAGAWAHATAHSFCPVGNALHAVVGHWLPMFTLMALGALLARRVLRG